MPARKPVTRTDPEKISGAVEKTKSKAEEYARDPEKARKLIDEAVKKARQQEKNKGPLADIWDYLTALFRLLRAYMRREYADIAWGSIVLVIVAIVYFVSPLDLIPDFIPALGFVDDAAVIAFVVAQVKVEIDDFLRWEADNKQSEPDSDE